MRLEQRLKAVSERKRGTASALDFQQKVSDEVMYNMMVVVEELRKQC